MIQPSENESIIAKFLLLVMKAVRDRDWYTLDSIVATLGEGEDYLVALAGGGDNPVDHPAKSHSTADQDKSLQVSVPDTLPFQLGLFHDERGEIHDGE